MTIATIDQTADTAGVFIFLYFVIYSRLQLFSTADRMRMSMSAGTTNLAEWNHVTAVAKIMFMTMGVATTATVIIGNLIGNYYFHYCSII